MENKPETPDSMSKNQFSMTAVLDAEKLRLMSEEGSPLPRLSTLMAELPERFIEAIEEALLPTPSYEIGYRFERILRWVADILYQLPLTQSSYTVTAESSRQKALEVTELIMHELSTFAEYLSKVLRTLAAGDEQLEKAAQTTGRRLTNEVVHLFKLPINKVKHDGYKLTWCEAKYNETVILGFSVYGPVAARTAGPATFHPKSPDIAEGYSFALFLRNTVRGLYRLCEIAESGVPSALTRENTQPSALYPGVLEPMRAVMPMLATLPRMGFPGENRHELCELILDGQTVRVLRTFRLAPLKPTAHITAYLSVVAPGHSYKLPFWSKK
ncbi:MAG: hypothetical protein JSR83_16545 [Proteobacteria bacterium]|nr:hypothetical protein [Pseudomonadota bacterium]